MHKLLFSSLAAAVIAVCSVSPLSATAQQAGFEFPSGSAPVAAEAVQPNPLMMMESDEALSISVTSFNQIPFGESCVVKGTVASVRMPDRGTTQPYTIFLQEGESIARIVIWPQDLGMVADYDAIISGAQIQVAGLATEFNGVRQLKSTEPNRFFVTTKATASAQPVQAKPATQSEFTAINQIGIKDIGANHKISGTITSLRESTSSRVPTIVTVKDETGEMTLVYWEEVSKALRNDQQPSVGDQIKAFGVVNEYRGTLQLKITNSSYLAKVN